MRKDTPEMNRNSISRRVVSVGALAALLETGMLRAAGATGTPPPPKPIPCSNSGRPCDEDCVCRDGVCYRPTPVTNEQGVTVITYVAVTVTAPAPVSTGGKKKRKRRKKGGRR